jgi:predicted ATPase
MVQKRYDEEDELRQATWGRGQATTISLSPLTDAETAQLIGASVRR